MNETQRAQFEKWKKSLPKCPESCDGDLEGEEHDADCPVGKAGGFATHADAFSVGYAAGAAAENEACKQIVSEEAYGHDPARMVDRIIDAIEARGKVTR